MTIKDKLEDITQRIKNSINERRAYIERKNKIFSYLGVKEVKALYLHYVSDDLTKQVYDRDKNGEYVKKSVKMSYDEIKRKVYRNVSIDQILFKHPHIKTKLEKK